MRVLVVNAGSSSLKLSVLDHDNRVLLERVDPLSDGADPSGPLQAFLGEAPGVDVAGHRVVHGGARFQEPVLLDPAVEAGLEELAGLAPLHNPPALGAITALARVASGLPAVACFDTSFHRTIPPSATTYALPPRGPSGACAVTVSTASLTPTSAAGPPSCSAGPSLGCAR